MVWSVLCLFLWIYWNPLPRRGSSLCARANHGWCLLYSSNTIQSTVLSLTHVHQYITTLFYIFKMTLGFGNYELQLSEVMYRRHKTCRRAVTSTVLPGMSCVVWCCACLVRRRQMRRWGRSWWGGPCYGIRSTAPETSAACLHENIVQLSG